MKSYLILKYLRYSPELIKPRDWGVYGNDDSIDLDLNDLKKKKKKKEGIKAGHFGGFLVYS